MNKVAIKFAASTLVLGLTMVACRSDSAMVRPNPASAARFDQQAQRLNGEARQAIQRGELAGALDMMERAVELSPRDAGYRLLLADIYLKSGRFEAAAATFADVLELDPNNSRAALAFSLSQIALGRPQVALGQLESLHGRASAADLGLAYALAGLPERAIELLEPEARSLGATPRIRQNLALSYALAGDWQRARSVAAQDVSPAELGARMEQWASMANPSGETNRVAQLLGVTPVADPGQPVRLALTPAAPAPVQVPAEPVAVAEAAPEIAPPEPQTFEPVQFAQAAIADQPVAPMFPVALPASEVAPEPAQEAATASESEPQALPVETAVHYAAAAQSLLRPEPAALPVVSETRAPAPVFERPRPRPEAATTRRVGNGRFVVQLGAYSTERNAERGWISAERRFGLADETPGTATFGHNGRTLHRVSVVGFTTHADASRMCRSVRARGGACFVRGNAGDAPVRWAARYGRNRDA